MVMGGARGDVDSSGNSTAIRKPKLPINGSLLPVPANQEKTLTNEVKEKTDGPRKQKETHASSSTTAPEKEKTDGPSSKQKETHARSSPTAPGKEKTDGPSIKQKEIHASSSPTAPGKEKTDGPSSKQKETHISSSTGKQKSSGPSHNKNESPPSKAVEKINNYPPISTGTAIAEVKTPTPRNTSVASLIAPPDPVDTNNYEGFTPSIRSSRPLVG